jgi:bacterial leucyl aminopeptidase
MRPALVLAAALVAAFSRFGAAAPVASDFAANAKAGLRLLSLEDGAEPVWKTEDEKLAIMREGKHFVSLIATSYRGITC